MIRKILAILTREEIKTFGSLTLADILISVADILFLVLLVFMVNFYSGNTPPTGTLAGWTRWLNHYNPVYPVLIFFLLFSGKNLAGFLNYRRQCRFLFRVATRISRDKLANYLEGPYAGYVNIGSSAGVREISHDPTEFAQHVLGGIQQVITQGVLIMLTIVAIMTYNAKLFLLLSLLLLPPIFAVYYRIRKKRHSNKDLARATSERSLRHLQEALTGYVESNIYEKNEAFLDRYISCQQQFNKYISDQLIAQGIPNRTVEIFALFGIVILIMAGHGADKPENAVIVTIGVFMAAVYKIIPGLIKILNVSGQIHTYSFTIRHLSRPKADRTGFSHPAPYRNIPATTSPGETTFPYDTIHSIQFRNVGFHYPDQPILYNLNLHIRQGDFLGISGHSGKGKTTILNLLLGFLTPFEGDVAINGKACNPADIRRYWGRISYVKQQSFLMHDSILRNITLNGLACDEARFQEAIRAAGLAGLIDTSTEKSHKLIVEDGKNISGGQRQRIAIARALYKDADLIILDEPFNELDEDSESQLLHYFKQLAQAGKMIVLITHNRQSLSWCNKTISLDEKRIVNEEG